MGVFQESYWLPIQRRVSASVKFARNWSEYEAGFGEFWGNFWIGKCVRLWVWEVM